MVLLSDYTIYSEGFTFINSSTKRKIINTLYNVNNKICLTRGLIEIIENEIIEKELFQAFIKEISDTGRIISENSNPENSFYEQFLEIYNNSKVDFLIPITVNNSKELEPIKSKLISFGGCHKVNKDWIVTEIITNGSCNVCYRDFKTNEEIKLFFEAIFDIPKFIKSVYIFNREKDSKYLKSLKGSNILFYTLLFNVFNNKHIHLEELNYLKKELGGKLKLYYTSDKRLIHERKIIIGSLIISSDNSFSNLLIQEPTWEINLSFDDQKAKEWIEKCIKFKQL